MILGEESDEKDHCDTMVLRMRLTEFLCPIHFLALFTFVDGCHTDHSSFV